MSKFVRNAAQGKSRFSVDVSCWDPTTQYFDITWLRNIANNVWPQTSFITRTSGCFLERRYQGPTLLLEESALCSHGSMSQNTKRFSKLDETGLRIKKIWHAGLEVMRRPQCRVGCLSQLAHSLRTKNPPTPNNIWLHQLWKKQLA